MMKTIGFQITVLLVSAFTALCCESGGRDRYLTSLRVTPEILVPIDSINMETWGIYSSSSLIKRGDWFLTRNSKGDCNVSAFNPNSGEILHFLPYGRATGEISMKGRLNEAGGVVSIHDFGTNTVVALNVEASLRQKEQILDTISRFTESMPYVNPLSCKSGFIATSFKNAKVWYVVIDPTAQEISSVNAIGEELLRNEEDPAMSMVNSVITVSPDGDKICCAAMDLMALSFSSIENGLLIEKKRFEMPRASDSKPVSNFIGIFSDNDRVYVLYSGQTFSSSKNEANWLLVYNWDGKPLKCYNLARSAFSLAVEGNTVYCTTDYPDSKIFVYQLD